MKNLPITPLADARNAKRAPLEFSAEVVERGFRPKLKCGATVFSPSQTGLALRTAQLLPLGTRLHIQTNPDPFTFPRPLRLRGRVVWSSPAEGSALYAAGIELESRGSDLKSWQSFILKRLRNLEG